MLRKLDISIVLYGFREDVLGPTFSDISASSELINRVWVLLSGDAQELTALQMLIQRHGLAEKVIVEHRYDNLGFASGHNRLLARAFKESSQTAACLVLNPDIRFSIKAMRELIEAIDHHPRSLFGPILGRVESAIQTEAPLEADSFGIGWTRTGRHFDLGQGDSWQDRPPTTLQVAGVTGACLMVPRAPYEHLVKTSGHFFDDLFIAYREDAELGVRSAALGIKSLVLPIAGFNHVRTTRGFERTNDLVNLLGVRNRFLIKWSLGNLRPGSLALRNLRDLGVVLVVFIKERTSLPGLREVFLMRRFAMNRGNSWRKTIRELKL